MYGIIVIFFTFQMIKIKYSGFQILCNMHVTGSKFNHIGIYLSFVSHDFQQQFGTSLRY